MIIRGGIWGRLKAGISTRCEAFKDWHNGSKFSKKYKGPVMLVKFNKFKAMEILSEMIPGEEYDIIVSGELKDGKRFKGSAKITITGWEAEHRWDWNPDYAVAEFAEDARRRVRRRTLVLQAPDNKTNSVKSATPCGFKCRKNISKISFTFWVKDLNTFVKYNRPILKIKFPFSVFEVHNSG